MKRPFPRRERLRHTLLQICLAALAGVSLGCEIEKEADTAQSGTPASEAPRAATPQASPARADRSPAEQPGAATASAPTKRIRPKLYDIPELSPEQLRSKLQEACNTARARSQPVLLEFSAPWCKDCRRLHEMKKEEALSQALARVQSLTVNVGDFDQHRSLLEAFQIQAIARWELLEPRGSCSAPPWMWRRLASRTLEPDSGRPVDAGELARWLQASWSPTNRGASRATGG